MTDNYRVAFWIAFLFFLGTLAILFITTNNFKTQIDEEKNKVVLLCDLEQKESEYANKLTDMINNFQINYFEPENITLLDKLTPLDCEAFK